MSNFEDVVGQKETKSYWKSVKDKMVLNRIKSTPIWDSHMANKTRRASISLSRAGSSSTISSSGTISSLPSPTSPKIIHMSDLVKSHFKFQKSFRRFEQPRSASILVLGPRYSGKSSVLNYLMGQQVAEIGDDGLNCITEYGGKVVTEESSQYYQLKLIDTPGYECPSDGRAGNDAALATTLISYLDSAQGLRGKCPTLTLIVIDIRSLTLYRTGLISFLKFLNNYQEHFINSKNMNAIFVLSHVNHVEYTVSNVTKLSKLIKKFCSFPQPLYFVAAENSRSESPMGVDENENEYDFCSKIYHNGRCYPNNLIERILNLLSLKGRDSMGESVLRTAFGTEYPYSIKPLTIFKKIPLFSSDHPTVINAKKILTQVYLDIERTEVSLLLEIGWENLRKTWKSRYNSTLLNVQQVLQAKKIKDFNQLPNQEEPLKVLELMKSIHQNPASLDLLKETLQLKVPACHAANAIGLSYDVGRDSWLRNNTSPFEFSVFKSSPAGEIPDLMECKAFDDRVIVFKLFPDAESYITERLKDLNIKHAILNLPIDPKPGYNIIQPNKLPNNSSVCTALIEYRDFKVSLRRCEELTFKESFWTTLTALPSIDEKEPTSINMWKEFFDHWGTHIVKSAFLGGSIQINFRGKILRRIYECFNKELILPLDEYDTSRVFQWVTGDGFDYMSYPETETFLEGFEVETMFCGGDQAFKNVNLSRQRSDQAEDIRDEWRSSLPLYSTALSSNLVLVPLSYYVRLKCSETASKIDNAFHFFYKHYFQLQNKQYTCCIS